MKYKNNIVDLTSLPEIDQILFCGDIHGNFRTLVFYLETKKITNSIIFVCGDCGLGFNKPQYYINEFNYLNIRLIKNNNYIVFCRGNHDNFSYFNNTEEICPQLGNSFERWIIAGDYDIFKTIEGNVLCIGGARSNDRLHRKEGVDFWLDEVVQPATEEQLSTLLYGGTPIDIVVSHTAPNYYFPYIPSTVKNKLTQIRIDDDFEKDNKIERDYLSSLYEDLMTAHKIKYWFHGHFHQSYYYMSGYNTKFYSLNIDELKAIDRFEDIDVLN
jgi:predicted phosphodiesterase